MVAYSFQRQFVAPILAGTKQQTIRADRKRHARPGERLQLYTGMRTKACRLIGRAVCSDVGPIRLWLDGAGFVEFEPYISASTPVLDDFARCDGFADWAELVVFWRAQHPDVGAAFSGVLITWKDFEGGRDGA